MPTREFDSQQVGEVERLRDLLESEGWRDFLRLAQAQVHRHRVTLLTSHTIAPETRAFFVGHLDALYNLIRETYKTANRMEDMPPSLVEYFRGEKDS